MPAAQRLGPAPRTLAPPPQAALQLPPTAKGAGDARTTVDLSEHPWAGAEVVMTLSAVSISGKTGESAPIEMTLPQRIFHNPLARALVEQRRNLNLDPDHAPKQVDTALTALAIAPELFGTPANIYLGLKQARTSLEHARSDADLLDVAALLWAMAQQIEDGDSTQAQRDLRAAEQALREALQRGASDQEIKKLMQQLREAANRFMSEMARNSPPDSNAEDQNLQAQDLDKLLDQMEDSARNGSREDAQAMLDQMQEMFENMRSAREGQESPADREMRKQIGELEKLLRDQQKLRDDTFRSDQKDHARRRARRNQSDPLQQDLQGQQDQDGSNAPDQGDNDSDQADSQDQDQADQGQPQLGDRQQELRDRLAELQRKLKSLGMKGEKGFDDAQGDMKEAEGDLKGGQGGKGPGSEREDRQGRGGRRPGPRARGFARRRSGPAKADGRPGPGQRPQWPWQLCRAQEPAGSTTWRGSPRPRSGWRERPRGGAAQGIRWRGGARAPGHGRTAPPPRRPRPPGRRTRLSRTADEAGLRPPASEGRDVARCAPERARYGRVIRRRPSGQPIASPARTPIIRQRRQGQLRERTLV